MDRIAPLLINNANLWDRLAIKVSTNKINKIPVG